MLLDSNCGVDTSPEDNFPVLCTLDFIESLDFTDTHQVVFVHDLRGHSFRFYYMYQECVGNSLLHTCCDGDIGPISVVDSRLANMVFCKQGLSLDMKVDLTTNQV